MRNKIFSILLPILAAIALWFYVITVVSPESEKTYYDIPVILQNKDILAERGLMIVSEDSKVTLTLKSDRTILNDLNESNINVLTSVTNIESPGVHQLTYNVAYPGNIPQNEVSVQSSSTDLITIKVERRIKKSVPVVMDYDDTAVPDGYIADIRNPHLDFSAIEIVGPESAVGKIEEAVIRVDLNGQTKTLVGDYQYVLCDGQKNPVDAENVTVNTETVNLMLTIQGVKEIALNVDVIYGGGATQKTCTVTIDPMQIQVSGSDALLEELDSLQVGTVYLADMLEDQVLKFPVVLPEGITNQTGVNEVTVDVKFVGMAMKTFDVTNITATNTPDGLQPEIITKVLPVTIRGAAEMVEAMRDTDLSVVVDMSEAQIGIATMLVDVIIPATYTDVGAVGTYPVTVKIQEAAADKAK